MDSHDRSKLLIISLAHFVNDSNVLVIISILPIIVKDFNLTYGETGILANITLLSMIFLQVLFGYISNKIDMGLLLSLGLFIIGIGGIVTSLSTNFITLVLSQFLVGVGASFYHPIGYSLTRRVFNEESKGFAFGFVSASGDVGVFVAFILNGFLSVIYGWRLPILLFSFLAILSAIPVFKLIKVGKWTIEKSNRSKTALSLSKISCILAVYFMLVSIYRITYSYVPLILSRWLSSQLIINLIFSMLTLAGIVGSIISGVIIDRYNILAYMLLISILMGIFPLIISISTSIIVVIISLSIFGFMLYSHYPIIYGYILGENISHDFGTIYGLTISVGMIGGFTISILTGVVADIYGINISMIITLIFSLILFFLYLCWIFLVKKK